MYGGDRWEYIWPVWNRKTHKERLQVSQNTRNPEVSTVKPHIKHHISTEGYATLGKLTHESNTRAQTETETASV